ncbi:MAG TPA: hypothetical protein VFA89_15755 [Terriglobales bacterium]|nr:hypothetical protein [Terriglobales bacterium]
MKFPLRSLASILAVSLCILPCSLSGAELLEPASGSDTTSTRTAEVADSPVMVTVPGPLRSFLRMAGISQKVRADQVLPYTARNAYAQGYEGTAGSYRPTEFLILLRRYIQQARELSELAGPERTIRVPNCGGAGHLLSILGYRLRQECGSAGMSLITADPERAFVTVDSGFPLPQLEEALQANKPFAYPFPESRVPLLFDESEWTSASKEKESSTALDALLYDPAVARLYWAFSRLDNDTAKSLKQSPGLKRLLPLSAVLDFYGTRICIRSGSVLVPGGASAEGAWKDLVGASPDVPPEFIPKLLAKDRGWLAAYFDALSRVPEAQQAHFTQPDKLRHYYQALRGPEMPPDAARSVFRSDPELLLLLTRLRWEADGQPHIPGDLEIWKEIFHRDTDSKLARSLSKRSPHWNNSEHLLEALFAISRAPLNSAPLDAYLALSNLDAQRPPERQLAPKTALLLASKYEQFSDQYRTFLEFPELTDDSIVEFLKTAEAIDKISNRPLRGNAMGMLQANVGLWQILARQGQISPADLNASWQKVVQPFSNVSSSARLFDAGRQSLEHLLTAATGSASASQDEVIDLLAGPRQSDADAEKIRQQVAENMRAVLDGQRLVSLDTLLALGDGLNEMAQGKVSGDSLLPLARELGEFEMPRPMFTGTERTMWSYGTYNNRHTELQMRTDLTKVIKGPTSPAKLEMARGELVPFLRDTLVGLNYAYYEPPGAQILHNNPLFVRSHDFAGDTVSGVEHVWQAPLLFGQGSAAGGGAHLVGSLAELPYVLATAEEDFVAPENVQALIWRELVPGLLTSGTLPRWWNVSRNELHAVALYQQTGEELLVASSRDEALHKTVISILADRMSPRRLLELDNAISANRVSEVLPRLLPADTFYLASEYRQKFPGREESWGAHRQELEKLCQSHPDETNWQRLSHDFGVPHPVLTQSYARELLNLEPFPSFEGYSSRLLAETWDSNNLYFARIADEMGYSPVALNRLLPVLTRRMVEKIFASNFEDWPALLLALREAGDEFRQGKITLAPERESLTRLAPQR